MPNTLMPTLEGVRKPALGGIGDLAKETESLLPGQIGCYRCCVVEGNRLAASVQGLRETEQLAVGERGGVGVTLIIVFCGEAILGVEIIVDVAICLIRLKN